MYRAYRPPVMILIDGLDGSGKKTISSQIARILTEAGYRVYQLDAPYYDTPAGALVTDYLTNGYGCIRDRSLTSLYYTIDRQNFLRSHFDEIFLDDPRYDFVIANRWTLSSLLYQTTIFPQKPRYTEQCTHSRSHTNAGDPLPRSGRTYTIYIDDGNTAVEYTLEELQRRILWLMKREQYSSELAELSFAMNHIRAQLVREHANLLYHLEIMPWWVEMEREVYLPFANFRSVVLVPNMETIHANLMKRAGGDLRKLDNNESSITYLESVVENIHWIRDHEPLIFAQTCPDPTEGELEPIVNVEGAMRTMNRRTKTGADYFLISPMELLPIEPVEAPARSFDYTIINTTHVVNLRDTGPQAVQKSKAQVLDEVWRALNLNIFHQLTAKDRTFPDD